MALLDGEVVKTGVAENEDEADAAALDWLPAQDDEGNPTELSFGRLTPEDMDLLGFEGREA